MLVTRVKYKGKEHKITGFENGKLLLSYKDKEGNEVPRTRPIAIYNQSLKVDETKQTTETQQPKPEKKAIDGKPKPQVKEEPNVAPQKLNDYIPIDLPVGNKETPADQIGFADPNGKRVLEGLINNVYNVNVLVQDAPRRASWNSNW